MVNARMALTNSLPWREGCYATWVVTVTNTVAASHLNNIASCAGSAAEAEASREEEKYSEVAVKYHIFRFAILKRLDQ